MAQAPNPIAEICRSVVPSCRVSHGCPPYPFIAAFTRAGVIGIWNSARAHGVEHRVGHHRAHRDDGRLAAALRRQVRDSAGSSTSIFGSHEKRGSS